MKEEPQGFVGKNIDRRANMGFLHFMQFLLNIIL
jgi:hypothetical protein